MHQGGSAELFTESKNIINYLITKDYLLFILSSDENETLLPHMDRLGITDKFTKIIGCIHEKKPVLANLVNEHNLDKSKTFYVGDTSGDIEAGKFAGVKTIGVSWGYQKKELLEKSQPDYLIDDILEIQNIV
jgi:phosphoglycolate phosphatase